MNWKRRLPSLLVVPSMMLVILVLLVSSGYAQNNPDQEKEKTATVAGESPKETPVDTPEKKDAEQTALDETTPEPDPRHDPIVTYLIEARLFPNERRITAEQTMSWSNRSQHTVDHLRFHLYYNAFRNPSSTFLKESNFYRKSAQKKAETKFGEIKVKDIRRINGGNLNHHFIAPDDNNNEDRTVMEIKLEKPLEPGQTIRLKMNFELTLPQIFARTGMEGNFYMIGQWFPKIGVLQKDGQWNCHQFHYNSEFYADYGEYKIVLTIPGEFTVGASGNLVRKELNADKSYTYYFEEKNIHDFAWTASTNYTRFSRTVMLPGKTEETEIILLLSPGHDFARDRYLNSAQSAMEFLSRNVYPYPYKTLTIVDPPLVGSRANGMEYPTLITGGALSLLPSALKAVEAVTIHEFGHQYWYGIVGSDEFTEAWLDEGVNSYFDIEVTADYFKNNAKMINFSFLQVDVLEFTRLRYASLQPVDPVLQPSWDFMNRNQYGNNVYSKAAVLLYSLRNLTGKDRMLNFFKFYVDKFKFKHPTTDDFVETFNTFMDEDFSWAFDYYIRSPGGLDHAVHSIRADKLTNKTGIYRNEAVFVRKEGYFPVELLITLANGKEIKSFWNEKEKWKRITFDDPSPIKQAVIDPLYKIPLDRNYLDNSKVRNPQRSGIRKLSLKLGFLFQNILGFFTL